MIRHNLTNPLSIPDSHENTDQTNVLSNQQQLELYAQQNTNVNDRICDDSISNTRSPSVQQNGTRLSTNSLSSISQQTHATIGTTVPYHGTCISKVINICNDIDTAENCIATDELVKKCVRNVIWNSNKFLSDLSIKAMKIENRDNPRSVLNILLDYTRKTELSNLDRLKFWKKYSVTVQQDLNNIKTICTRSIKEEIMSGMYSNDVTII